MAEKWSGAAFTAADVADINASTSSFMGIGATATDNFKMTAGKVAQWIATVGFAALAAVTVVSPAAVAWGFPSASGVDNAAGNFTLTAPLSTGAATPARMLFQVGVAGASAATLQTATTVGVFSGDGSLTLGLNAATLATTAPYTTDTNIGLRLSSKVQIYRAASNASVRLLRVNTSFTAPSPLLTTNAMGSFDFGGYDGSTIAVAAQVSSSATENWSGTARGTNLAFSITPNTTTTLTDAMVIDNTAGIRMIGVIANNPQLTASGGSLTGSNASTFWSYAGTLNTSGDPSVTKWAITQTAAGANSLLLDYLGGASANTRRWAVDLFGRMGVGGGVSTTSMLNVAASGAGVSLITSSGFSLTGSSAVTMYSLAGTWNTSGTPTAFSLAITNTASNASSLLFNFLAGAGGVTSMASLTVGGALTIAGQFTSGTAVVSGADVRAASGSAFYWNNRTFVTSPLNGQMNISNFAADAGIGFDVLTDAVLKLRVRAQNADATMSSLQHWFTGAATAPSAGQLAIGGTQQTTIGANGAASALTANPLGYIIGKIGSTSIVIPYYNA